MSADCTSDSLPSWPLGSTPMPPPSPHRILPTPPITYSSRPNLLQSFDPTTNAHMGTSNGISHQSLSVHPKSMEMPRRRPVSMAAGNLLSESLTKMQLEHSSHTILRSNWPAQYVNSEAGILARSEQQIVELSGHHDKSIKRSELRSSEPVELADTSLNRSTSLSRSTSFVIGDDRAASSSRMKVDPAGLSQLENLFKLRKARRKSAVSKAANSNGALTPTGNGESSPSSRILGLSKITSSKTRVVSTPPETVARPLSAQPILANTSTRLRHVSASSADPLPEPLNSNINHRLSNHSGASQQGSQARKASHNSHIDGILPHLTPPPAAATPPVPLHGRLTPRTSTLYGVSLVRPVSTYSVAGSEILGPARNLTPIAASNLNMRTPSPSTYHFSTDGRRASFADLLNIPYPQPPPAATNLLNSHLQSSVGDLATRLDTKKTLELYRLNAKKTADVGLQYEFAVFMVSSAKDIAADEAQDSKTAESTYSDLLREARQILQRLADRSYPYAQYYLADGYASGLFNKSVADDDRAFPLFVAASKHGHAEAGYRAALCYEFGWGTRKDPPKAIQFYRHAASKSHPGAMARLGRACMLGDMGLTRRPREGITWLKRAVEAADRQYNAAPYDLARLHQRGYPDGDIFPDLPYAAQLYTQAGELGHAEANYVLGDAYEHGKLACPRDPALSVHFYTGAAQTGHAAAMMALCAWYMVGAEPILMKDESEAYEWAHKAAETGLAKAEYAVGFFTEMGIGTRRDPLEANVWYVRAAEQGDERARIRIAAIQAATEGNKAPTESVAGTKNNGAITVKKRWGLF